MSDLLCPFSAPLIKNDFACTNAKEIIRRGGAEIACKNQAAHKNCSALHNAIRAAALQAMDLEDDLLTLPHNALVKIQYGGLLGLKIITEADIQQNDSVDDVVSLVSNALDKFSNVDNIPLSSITKTIIEYKVQRRRKK